MSKLIVVSLCLLQIFFVGLSAHSKQQISQGRVRHCGAKLCAVIKSPRVFFSSLDHDLLVFDRAEIEVIENPQLKPQGSDSVKKTSKTNHQWPRNFHAKDGHLDWSLGLLTLRSTDKTSSDIVISLTQDQVRVYP